MTKANSVPLDDLRLRELVHLRHELRTCYFAGHDDGARSALRRLQTLAGAGGSVPADFAGELVRWEHRLSLAAST